MAWSDLSFDYAGHTVLVTGGTSGIGAAIAAAYAECGADVVTAGTRATAADYDEPLAEGRYLQIDITDDASIDRGVAALDRLDILVNCAGIAIPAPGDQYDPATFDLAVRMHLTGVYRLTHGCAPMLEASDVAGGASVLCIGSTSAYFGHAMVPGYSAAKAGQTQLIKSLAMAWAARGIRVNGIAPGLTRSRMTAVVFENPEMGASTFSRTPLGRLGEPVDMAGAALFLTSSAASFITGQTLPIDGGFTICG